MNKNLWKKLISNRIKSPNNATATLLDILRDDNIELITNGKRNIAIINNKKYAVSITGHDKYVLDCRQYELGLDGLVSLWEADGQIYMVDDLLLEKHSKTREMNGRKYVTIKSKESISYLTPSVFVSQIDSESYKDMYIAEAEIIAKELVSSCKSRMLNRY